MAEEIELYHYWTSTCSQKARFVLEEKGLAWRSHHVDLFKFEHWEDDYLSLNSNGMVPTLVVGDTVIADSNIMLEYLDDHHAEPPLRPAGAAERAAMRSWMKLADRAQEAVIKIGYNLRIKPRLAHYSRAQLREIGQRNPNPEFRRSWLRKLETGVSREEIERGYEFLERMAQRIDQAVEHGEWLAGNRFSLADIAISPYLKRIEVLEHPEILAPGNRPHLAAWWEKLQRRPAFIEAYSFQDPGAS